MPPVPCIACKNHWAVWTIEIFATCWCGRKITVSIKVKLYTGCACDLSLDRHANLETGAAIGIGLYTDVHGPLATKRSSCRSSHSAKIAKLKSKSQKVFDFSIFSTFRAEISWNVTLSTFRLFAKSQKVKKFSTFRIFQFFRFFRLFEQKSPGMWTFRLFGWNFSTTVGVWIAKSEKPIQNFKHFF